MPHLLHRSVKLTVLHRQFKSLNHIVLQFCTMIVTVKLIIALFFVFCSVLSIQNISGKREQYLIFSLIREIMCWVYVHDMAQSMISFCTTNHKSMALKPVKPSSYFITCFQLQHSKIVSADHTVSVCVVYGSRNKQRLFLCTELTDCFYNQGGLCLLHSMNCIFGYNSGNFCL